MKVWEVGTGKLLRELDGFAAAAYGVEWSPDGKRLAGASWDGTALIWRVADWVPIARLSTSGGRMGEVHWAPDGKTLATGGVGRIDLWDTSTWARRKTLRGPSDPVWALAWAPGATGSWRWATRGCA